MGLINSVAHVEIIITENGPKLVELGSRLGGDCITSYLIDTSVSGINMTQAAVEQSLGIKPDISNFDNSGICSAVRFIPTQKGALKSIKGVANAEKVSGVIKVYISGKIGKYYSDATDDSARFGYVVCKGETTKEALQRCQDAVELIDFELG